MIAIGTSHRRNVPGPQPEAGLRQLFRGWRGDSASWASSSRSRGSRRSRATCAAAGAVSSGRFDLRPSAFVPCCMDQVSHWHHDKVILFGAGTEQEEEKVWVSIKNFAKQSITSFKLTHMGIQSFFVWFMYSCITLQRIRTIVLSRRRLLAHHHLVVIVFRNHLLGGRRGQMRISCIIIDRSVTCNSRR